MPRKSSKPKARTVDELTDALEFIERGEIGDMLEINASRVSALIKEGVIEQDAHGRLPRRETVHGLFRWMRGRLGEGKTALGELKLERQRLENEILSSAAAKARGTAIAVEDVDRAWAHIGMLCRQKFLRLANKLAPRIPFMKSEQEIESAIQTEIDEALGELSRAPEYQPEKQEA